MENGEFFLTINSIKHWVKIAGAENETVPLVIIHGGPGGNNYTFERTIGPYLEEYATIIYYEQRGCGRSEAPQDKDAYFIPLLISDLEILCKDLKLEKIIPLGFSFGSELALEFVLIHPDLVEKLIVQAPTTFCDANNRISNIQLNGFLQIAKGNLKKQIKEIINSELSFNEKIDRVWEIVDTETTDKLLFHNREYAKQIRKLWEESGINNTDLMYKALKKQQNELLLLERVAQINIPTLIFVGLYDRNVGIDLCRDFSSKIPNSKLIIFEKSAHFPDIEESEKYAQLVEDFIF